MTAFSMDANSSACSRQEPHHPWQHPKSNTPVTYGHSGTTAVHHRLAERAMRPTP